MTIANRVIETSTDNLSVRVGGGLAVARLRSDIDVSVTGQLLDVLSAVVPVVKHLDIYLDEVTFMDSSGVTLLVHVARSAQANGTTIVLHNPTPLVLRLLQLTALDSVFDIR